jgi:hypothetical protein
MEENEVRSVLARHDKLWSGLRFEELVDLWDREFPGCAYIGEEYLAPILGWSELDRHWGRHRARLRRAELSTIVHEVAFPADAVAIVVGHTRWEFETRHSSAVMGGEAPVSVVMRNRDDAWRIISYTEGAAQFDHRHAR